MLGKPKYDYGDIVSFKIKTLEGNEVTLMGEVYIIDEYGTFWDSSDVSYDIMVSEGDYPQLPCLFKHFREDRLTLVKKNENFVAE